MTGHWNIEEEQFDPNEWFGFVYIITNIENGRKYIGRKQLNSRRRHIVKGRKNRKVIIKESNWKEYTGSCVELNEDIAQLGKEKFIFQVLRLCKTKRELSYAEVEEQFRHDVLNAKLENGEREFYNRNIMSRFFVLDDKAIEKSREGLLRIYQNGYINPMKGKPPWNKGLTRETDSRLGSTKGYSIPHTDEWNKKIGEAQKGKPRPGAGYNFKQEQRPAWNKGLTKEDPRVAKYINAKIGKKYKKNAKQT